MFVDALFKRQGETEVIRIVERVNGERIYKEYPPDYHFFLSDPKGTHKSIYNTPLKKVIPSSYADKQKILKTISHNSKKWESDVDPVFRCLEHNYSHGESPKLHVAFFDIETSFDKEYGWSEAADANNYITSISIHLQWCDELLCLAIPPDTLSEEEAQQIADEVGSTILFKTEMDMLNAFIDVIEDADVLCGWNSRGYDIPYVVNRIKKILGKQEARRLCLWNESPKEKTFSFGGKESKTYELVGRVSLDYMELYKKYNYEERQSYALNAIAEAELGEHKVQYDGTLDDLYHDDFKTFLEYNIQDTRLLDRLDKKLQFIELANTIAHSNCVLIQSTAGTVAVTDQAIMIEAHSRNMICPDKKRSARSNDDDDEMSDADKANRAAGGWVAVPKPGLHEWVASTDMKSLYPSVIRAGNMSPETIVGQIRLDRTNGEIAIWEAKKGTKYTFASWWNDRFNVLEMEDFYNNDIATKMFLDMENGDTFELTGAELRQLIFSKQQSWCISANGTIFKTDVEGIIPGLLARWYSERKALQKIAAGINSINAGLALPDDVLELF